jgi:histidine triad (HIT) family protein
VRCNSGYFIGIAAAARILGAGHATQPSVFTEARMSDNCLFCRIARHEIPAHIIHEDERLLAFLDIQPVRPGHTLIIPKQHYPYYEDMPADLAGHILNLGQKLGRHMKRLYGVERVGFAFTGIHVAHAHAHIIPMHHTQDVTSTQYIEQQDLTFRMPPQPPQEALAATAAQLRGELHAS